MKKFTRHQREQQITQEFDHMDKTKEHKVCKAGRAPNAGDKVDCLWIDTTGPTLYFKDPTSGAWTSL